MLKNLSEINNFIITRLQDSLVPALSLALYAGGEMVYKRGYGRRNLKYGEPADSGTIYGIGSISKSFVCMALMQLQEKGRLSIDDSMSDYLDIELKPGGDQIKIRHLMSHTSGIPGLGYAGTVLYRSAGGDVKDAPIGSVEDMIDYMHGAEEWAEASPGKRWFYSNEGYVLLGGIIEKVSGRKFTEYLQENIFRPLGMEETYFHRDEVESHQNYAQPYLIGEGGEREPAPYLYGDVYSDGNIISSVEDLSRYLRLYLDNGGVKKTSGKRDKNDRNNIISRSSLQKMIEPQVKLPERKALKESGQSELEYDYKNGERKYHYGYGWQIEEDFFGHKLVGHGGSMLVSTGYTAFLPEENISVALLASGSGCPLKNIARYLLANILGESAERLAFKRREKHIKALTGTYQAYEKSLLAMIEREGDLLRCRLGTADRKRTLTLIPENLSDDICRFFALENGKKLPAQFKRTGSGVELILGRHKFRRLSRQY